MMVRQPGSTTFGNLTGNVWEVRPSVSPPQPLPFVGIIHSNVFLSLDLERPLLEDTSSV